jgi:hypothetical protein
MAKKINVKLILELRDAGMSRNGIASTRHMSRHSVSDVFHLADERGITYKDVHFLDEKDVYRMFYPDKFAVDDPYKDPDYEYIHQELRKTGVTLKLLWEEYKLKKYNYLILIIEFLLYAKHFDVWHIFILLIQLRI